MKRVYIETTIPSVYFETRRTTQASLWRQITRDWWSAAKSTFQLVTSEFVVDEIARGPADKAEQCLELLSGVETLERASGFETVVAEYVRRKVMPVDSLGDAAHLAMASTHGIEFLLTWNFRHLANANKAQHIRIVNQSLGLAVPVIASPLTLGAEG
ncbi:MAG: type II toxin-antitoxin system VapC family toxin [Phycisphaerales bacterium]